MSRSILRTAAVLLCALLVAPVSAQAAEQSAAPDGRFISLVTPATYGTTGDMSELHLEASRTDSRTAVPLGSTVALQEVVGGDPVDLATFQVSELPYDYPWTPSSGADAHRLLVTVSEPGKAASAPLQINAAMLSAEPVQSKMRARHADGEILVEGLAGAVSPGGELRFGGPIWISEDRGSVELPYVWADADGQGGFSLRYPSDDRSLTSLPLMVRDRTAHGAMAWVQSAVAITPPPSLPVTTAALTPAVLDLNQGVPDLETPWFTLDLRITDGPALDPARESFAYVDIGTVSSLENPDGTGTRTMWELQDLGASGGTRSYRAQVMGWSAALDEDVTWTVHKIEMADKTGKLHTIDGEHLLAYGFPVTAQSIGLKNQTYTTQLADQAPLTVSSPAGTATITFDGLSSTEGQLTVATDHDGSHEGFDVAGTTFLLSLPDGVTFSSARVCFTYTDHAFLAMPESTQESSLRLWHGKTVSGEIVFEDITDDGYPDVTTNTLCGTTTSFSPFFMGVRSGQVQPPPAAPTTLEASARPKRVTYGTATSVKGRLVSAGAGVAQQNVALQRRHADGSWRQVATATTDRDGVVAFAPRPPATTVYRLHFAGTTNHLAATSSNVKVAVATRVSAALSAARVAKGDRARVTGKVAPKHKGQQVVLQRRAGTRWQKVAAAKLTRRSTYAFALPTRTRGKVAYRVVKPADHDHVVGHSPTRTLTVR